jgi:hypothetical protein
MHAPECGLDQNTLQRSSNGHRAKVTQQPDARLAVSPRFGERLDRYVQAATLLGLQNTVGNVAVTRMLSASRASVQRCGGTPCSCL